MRIICFGPGPRFKGGIQNYNTSLALALDRLPDTAVHIVSWTQQYPAIIPREFVDKSSTSDLLEGSEVQVKYITNYNNPFSWKETADYILSLKPDMVIFQWSIALQGLPLGRIIRRLRKAGGPEVIVDLHFVIQKEGSSLDRRLTRFGIDHANTYIVHAMKTWEELKELFPEKELKLSLDGRRAGEGQTVIKLFHPVYDLFKPDQSFDKESFKRELGLKKHVFLFFGFIRKYKGLHQVIRAFRKVRDQRDDVSLLICGESFWQTLDQSKWSSRLKTTLFGAAKSLFLRHSDDERNYRPLDLIDELQLRDDCVVVNRFIPNEEVHKYFQVSDAVVLYYLTATPSGIESLSYNFSLPFPETIRDGYNGYLANDHDVEDMARQMIRFLDHPLPGENVREATRELSWDRYARAVVRSSE
jgi:glycosyltransferase involved in cell wall biosynthesis